MSLKNQHLSSLERRLESLERQNRRLKGLTIAGAVCLGAALLLGAGQGERAADRHGPDRDADAEDLVVRDRNGKVRARLGMLKGDAPALMFYDREGTVRCAIGIVDEVPRLDFFDPSRCSRIWLGVSKEGMAGMNLYDQEGNAGEALGVAANGEPRIELRKGARKKLFTLSTQ